jgi:lauroyl/myristoyl acyltransferase
MDRSLYLLGRVAMAFIQAMPLLWIAWVGRVGGTIIFWLDRRHRKVAVRNLTFCFHPQKTRREIYALALENFRRIGETYCCAIKTSGMAERNLKQVMEVAQEPAPPNGTTGKPSDSCIYATGHFGNFELFCRLPTFIHGYQCAASYRGMRPAALNRLIFGLRTKATGSSLLFERRTDADALKKVMGQGKILLLLVADQSTRDSGLELPFLGRNCFTSRAPAVMAARYGCDLYVPICYRLSLGRWRIEVGGRIPTRENGSRRSIEAITRDINTVMEAAVRRDPANWFWVHNRWKTKGTKPKAELVPMAV